MTQKKETIGLKNRRSVLQVGSVALFGGLAGCSDDGGNNGNGGGDYNLDISGTIRIITHGSEGGGYDTYARLVARLLPDYIDNDVVVENVTGAGGQVALQETWNADPNGTLIQLADTQSFAIMQAKGENDGWNLNEYTHIAGIAEDVRSLNVSIDSGIKSFDDYIQAVQNDKVTFGWTAPTSSLALVPVFIGELGGYYDPKIVIERGVQFDGGAEVRAAFERNEVQAGGGSWASNYEAHLDGSQRMLMYMADVEKPPEETPNIATLKTANVDNANQIGNILTGRRHFMGPPDMEDGLTQALWDLFRDVIQSNKLKSDAQDAGRTVTYLTGEDMKEFIPEHIELWKGQQKVLDVISG